MNSVKFGDVHVNQISRHGGFLHLRVTADGPEGVQARQLIKDRPDLEPLSRYASDYDTPDTVRFILGVGRNIDGVRFMPGHMAPDEADIFSLGGKPHMLLKPEQATQFLRATASDMSQTTQQLTNLVG